MADPTQLLNGSVCNHLYLLQKNGTCGEAEAEYLGMTIFVGVAKSLGTTVALGVVGFYLARSGVLGPQALKAMGAYTKLFAIPCLFFVQMADGISSTFLKHAWFVLLMPFAHTIVGVLLGTLVSVLVPHPSGHRGTIQVNINSKPAGCANSFRVAAMPHHFDKNNDTSTKFSVARPQSRCPTRRPCRSCCSRRSVTTW
eukprot:SAG31_NODE_1017_length_10360_cov_35.198811_6_plen_198_part_00